MFENERESFIVYPSVGVSVLMALCPSVGICILIATHTTAMISAVILLICENCLTALTTAKPMPPITVSAVLQPGLWCSG